VRFWDASGVCLRLLYKLSTVRVFLTDTDPSENLIAQGEDEWPPLRKVRPGAWESGVQGPKLGCAVATHRHPHPLAGGLL
jgi:lethal(2) giant larvae protein